MSYNKTLHKLNSNARLIIVLITTILFIKNLISFFSKKIRFQKFEDAPGLLPPCQRKSLKTRRGERWEDIKCDIAFTLNDKVGWIR